MKLYKIIFPIITIGAMIMSSCADQNGLGYSVTEPDSIAALEYLKAYKPLKSYIDTVNNPNFKLGVGIAVSDFNSKDVLYRLYCSNFNNMTCGYEMKEGSVVQSDGSLDTSDVVTFLKNAKSAGMSVFGHNLVWHSGQNATYLNKLIAPDTIKNGSGVAGYAFKIVNPSTTSGYWGVQCCYGLSTALTEGATYELKFMVKGSAKGSLETEMQSTDYTSDGFGTISVTTDWQSIDLTTKITATTRTRLIMSIGSFAGTLYIDNISLTPVSGGNNIVSNGDFENGTTSGWGGWGNSATFGISAYGEGYNPGETYVVKTAGKKDTILTTEMQRYIKGMMAACNPYVHAWDVVNEPMSDSNPSELKTGSGQTLSSDEFYWQDYLGKNYGVKAFNFAREYGNSDDKLFINEYGLESANQAKLNGLINYISYIESQGATVDGIGTQMHVSTSTADTTAIIAMLKTLASTGKLIKISELDMGISDGVTYSNVTDAELQAQAKLYNFIVRAYFKYIPKAQRYGITVWSPTDSSTSSSWRAGQPIGLWTLEYDRKRAYGGFADGLAGNYCKF